MLWIACATPTPPEDPLAEAEAEPIALGPGGSRPIAFLHVVERIPAGALLGVARWKGSRGVIDEIRAKGSSARSKSYNVAITDLLQAHGYTVRDEADAVFDAGREIRVRYQIAGVLHDVEVDYEYMKPRRPGISAEGVGTAAVDLELQVYDVVRNEPVYQRRYSGRGRDEGTEPQPIVPAVVDAVRNALADADFVAAVAERGRPAMAAAADPSSVRVIERCAPESAAAAGRARPFWTRTARASGGLPPAAPRRR